MDSHLGLKIVEPQRDRRPEHPDPEQHEQRCHDGVAIEATDVRSFHHRIVRKNEAAANAAPIAAAASAMLKANLARSFVVIERPSISGAICDNEETR
jgi:hypothetical protein